MSLTDLNCRISTPSEKNYILQTCAYIINIHKGIRLHSVKCHPLILQQYSSSIPIAIMQIPSAKEIGMAKTYLSFKYLIPLDLMQGVCESIIRCFCSCLINQSPATYSEVNEEHLKFMQLAEHPDEDHPHPQKQLNHSLQTADTLNNSRIESTLEQVLLKANPADKQPSLVQDLLGQQPEQLLDYSHVIESGHPYYDLFKDKLALLPSIFSIPEIACSAEPDTAYPLKLYCYQQGKVNVFKYFFSFPTDYASYESVSSDFELQKKFDSNIDEFRKQVETPGGEAQLIYLSYKKVLIMSSRDFEYVRLTFRRGKEWWVLCTSDPSREEVKGKVRGEMILTATRVIEKEGRIEVSVSSQTDMKIPIKLQIAKNRGFAQIRKYLDKVHQHLIHQEHGSL